MGASRPWRSSGTSAETGGHLVEPWHLNWEIEITQYASMSPRSLCYSLHGMLKQQRLSCISPTFAGVWPEGNDSTYRVFFLTGPPPEFAKCWPVSNWFQKNIRVSDWPPLMSEKKSKCLVILILRRLRGGPVEGFMGGASLQTFSGEGQLKKTPCIHEH